MTLSRICTKLAKNQRFYNEAFFQQMTIPNIYRSIQCSLGYLLLSLSLLCSACTTEIKSVSVAYESIELQISSSIQDLCVENETIYLVGGDEWDEGFIVQYHILQDTIILKQSTRHQLECIANGDSCLYFGGLENQIYSYDRNSGTLSSFLYEYNRTVSDLYYDSSHLWVLSAPLTEGNDQWNKYSDSTKELIDKNGLSLKSHLLRKDPWGVPWVGGYGFIHPLDEELDQGPRIQTDAKVIHLESIGSTFYALTAKGKIFALDSLGSWNHLGNINLPSPLSDVIIDAVYYENKWYAIGYDRLLLQSEINGSHTKKIPFDDLRNVRCIARGSSALYIGGDEGLLYSLFP